ncbi:MAG TPA: alanine racemase, partial [Patescibacteria group bacterium]|nr:alanine racemase [Patescibacteria group bacterium]
MTAALRWADVNAGAVRANCARIVDHLPRGVRLIAVVKAAGYGHGALQVARAALDGGASGLAVSTLEEAVQLTGLVKPHQVLVMGGLTPEQAHHAAATGCEIGVSSGELAAALGDTDQVVPVHLKIDTGMGRYGCEPADAPGLARIIDRSPGLRLAGTWTHFAAAGTDEAMTRSQFDLFISALAHFDVDPGIR